MVATVVAVCDAAFCRWCHRMSVGVTVRIFRDDNLTSGKTLLDAPSLRNTLRVADSHEAELVACAEAVRLLGAVVRDGMERRMEDSSTRLVVVNDNEQAIHRCNEIAQHTHTSRPPAFSLFAYPSADIMHELWVAIWCVRQRRVPFVNDGSGFDACQIHFRHQSRETSLIRAAHNLAHSPGPLHVPVVFDF